MESRELVVATYNIHRCVGADGACVPYRVAEVLADLGADIVALQEVDSRLPEHGVDQLALFARLLHARPIAGPTLRHRRGAYGNALLVRRPVLRVHRLDLSVPGREPRGALDVTLDVGGLFVRVMATHLGLSRRERARQVRRLLEAHRAHPPLPTLLLGDVNEWLPGCGIRRALDAYFGPTGHGPTFPARWPLFVLDRIFVQPLAALVDIGVVVSRAARLASDHLPVRARLDSRALAEPTAWSAESAAP
jgi:endonuclease/exonuclease/phosphatase family metal-dependent hydrolase